MAKTQLNQLVKTWEQNGFRVKIADAPEDAVTFDKMVVVFNESGLIRLVYFYSSIEDKILGQF